MVGKSKIDEYKYAVSMIAGSILLALILIFAVGKPLFDGMQKTAADLKDKKETLAKMQVRLENLKKLKDKEADLKTQNAKVLAALPEGKDVARLFVQFEGIATASGLSVKQAGEGTAAASGGTQSASPASTGTSLVKSIGYQVTATSPDYTSLKNSLAKFEEALRLLSVSGVNISKSGDSLNVSFNIITYTRGN
jgi:hypothetical protein